MKHGQKTPRRQRIFSAALNVLIGVLLLVLFLQCGIYIARSARVRRARSGVPFDMRVLSASTKDVARNLNPDLLLPETVAVQNAGETRAIFNSVAVMGDLCSDLSGTVLSAFSGEPVRQEESVWHTALTQNGVYVRYLAEFPYQILHVFAAAAQGSAERLYRTEPYIGVREMIFLAGSDGSLDRVFVRGAGGVYSFSAETELMLADVQRYAEEYDSLFYRCTLQESTGVAELTVDAPISARSVVISDRILSLLSANADDWNVFLRLLDFNPDKLNTHTEPDGTRVYVESHGVLRTDSYGITYQATESSGVSAAALSGTSGSFDVYAALRASSYLIARLSEMNAMYTGGDAALMLNSVSAAGEALTLTFGYRCDNIPLLGSDGEDYLTVTFTGGRLTELHFRMIVVSRSLVETRVFLQTWSRQLLAPEDGAEMRLVYRTDSVSNTASAQWAAVVATREEDKTTWAGTD